MAGTAVIVPFYATAFRKDDLAAALSQIGAISLRYGAKGWHVYQSQDDLYRFTFIVDFERKDQWEAYWYGEEFASMRAACSGWYQVPVLYNWNDIVGDGSLNGNGNGVHAEAQASASLGGVDPFGLAVDVRPQAHQRLADDPRDLHLRDADALGDLRLREVLPEAQPQHLAVADRQHPERVVEQHPHLRATELGVAGADRVRQRRRPRPSARRASACGGRPATGSSSGPPRRAARTALAISCTVGERPSSVVSLSRALAISICSSCIPRGTRIAQVLSRK